MPLSITGFFGSDGFETSSKHDFNKVFLFYLLILNKFFFLKEYNLLNKSVAMKFGLSLWDKPYLIVSEPFSNMKQLEYSVLADILRIGSIFIRIYC